MKKIALLFLGIIITAAFPAIIFAATDDIALLAERVSIPATMLEGKRTRFYATVVSLDHADVKGVIRFFTAGKQLGADQPVSVVAGKEDSVFIDAELAAGTYQVLVRFFPFDAENDNPNNNSVTKTVTVIGDADRDGKPDETDPDDDNDGVLDSEDAFPLNYKETKDTDSDGKGNNADTDDDNDGVSDEKDCSPLDAALFDDSDNDKVCDKEDLFPKDPNETKDFDSDGIGDNSDKDADSDNLPKEIDVDDLNLGPAINVDGLPAFPFPSKNPVTLDFSDTSDPDGTVQNVVVTLKMPNSEKETPLGLSDKNTLSFVLDTPGQYVLKVTATDDKKESREKTFTINVRNTLIYVVTFIAGILVLTLAIFGFLAYSSRAAKIPVKVPVKAKKPLIKQAARVTKRRSK